MSCLFDAVRRPTPEELEEIREGLPKAPPEVRLLFAEVLALRAELASARAPRSGVVMSYAEYRTTLARGLDQRNKKA
jgi:hypothetical protein